MLLIIFLLDFDYNLRRTQSVCYTYVTFVYGYLLLLHESESEVCIAHDDILTALTHLLFPSIFHVDFALLAEQV